MRISKNDIPVKIDAPGAMARQQTGFGDATDLGMFGGEHFSLAAGADLAPLLKGLAGDLCQSPHWGYIIGGELTVNYGDGTEEKALTGDLIYWPPGHTIRAEKDSEFVLFSPQHEHTPVMDHVRRQMM
jgi:hypothetical protein